MAGACAGRAGRAGREPRVGHRVVPSAREEGAGIVRTTTPHDHVAPGPDDSVAAATHGRTDESRGTPGVRGWRIAAAGVDADLRPEIGVVEATPDDHLRAGPDALNAV